MQQRIRRTLWNPAAAAILADNIRNGGGGRLLQSGAHRKIKPVADDGKPALPGDR